MIFLYVLIGIAVLALLYLFMCYFIAGTIIHLNRQPIPRNPKYYGMDFEDIEFKTSDGVAIRGWLIPGVLNKLVVMTHVGGLTKYGSTISYKNLTKLYNKEVEFPLTARHLHDAGYWVLMFDFRNHGESGADPDRGIAGVGLKEYRDVVAAMDYIKGRDELRDMNVGFVSFCMGANSTIIAMSKEPDAFKNVKCLFAIQPISFEVFIRTYAKKLFTPVGAKLMLPMIKKFVVRRGGYPLETMSPGAYVKDLKVPTRYVQARNDPWTELSDIEGFYARTPDNPKEFFWIEDTTHRFESYTYFQDKPEVMLEWVKKWV
ncbi:MAG: alpha/beta hydrolase [Dehalococcoidia bacterium]|nr:alpha/beta hydrolase [Dehalococcoidia bacterium]MDD5493859.1 alpha/beta hydrolase [Dehalococcoidia bacterium]